MFGFLKKGFQEVVKKFSKAAEPAKEDVKPEEPIVEKPIEEIKAKAQEIVVAKQETVEKLQPEEKITAAVVEPPQLETQKPETPKPAEIKEETETLEYEGKVAEKKKEEKPVEKKGFFQKFTEKFMITSISSEKFDEIFWDLEVMMLENSVAVEVIEKLKKDLKEVLVEKPLDKGNISNIIKNKLKDSLEELFAAENIDFIMMSKQKKPLIIMFAGINGSGKTTTIAKVANMLKKNNLKSVIAASDTFRAAAIQQLQEHADKLGVKMIKHDYGSDPAAVAFDAIKYAEANSIDIVLIDTAGRLHTNTNLIDELKKIVRVTKPDLKIFVGEAISGNDCTNQAKEFNESIGLDGIILAKADIDEKGGAMISASYITKKPILFLGTGQSYDDLEAFDSRKIIENLGL